MNGNRRFVDTNVLVYAHDDSAGHKRDQARALIEQLWESRDGCLSVQVLQEFFVSVTRKIAKPLDADTAKEIIADLSRWRVHVPAADDVVPGEPFRDAHRTGGWQREVQRHRCDQREAVLPAGHVGDV